MRVVTPEQWYIGFWCLMGLAFLVGVYVVIVASWVTVEWLKRQGW